MNGIFMSSTHIVCEWGKWTEQSMNKKKCVRAALQKFPVINSRFLSQVEISRESRLICEKKECNFCSPTHPPPSLSAHSSVWGPTSCGFFKFVQLNYSFYFSKEAQQKKIETQKEEEVKIDIISPRVIAWNFDRTSESDVTRAIILRKK